MRARSGGGEAGGPGTLTWLAHGAGPGPGAISLAGAGLCPKQVVAAVTVEVDRGARQVADTLLVSIGGRSQPAARRHWGKGPGVEHRMKLLADNPHPQRCSCQLRRSRPSRTCPSHLFRPPAALTRPQALHTMLVPLVGHQRAVAHAQAPSGHHIKSTEMVVST